MRYTMRGRMALLVILGLLSGRLATAAPIGFTQRSAYDTAAAGLAGLNTLDFESLSLGALPGGWIQGIAFAFSIGGFAPEVVDFVTTSGTHSLGTHGDGVFLAGDSFTMTFATATHALGLYVIAADQIFAGDFTLAAAGGSVSNSVATDSGFPIGVGGGKVFFLGLVDEGAPFTTVTFSSNGLADFFFNIDDITGQIDGATPAPVPEPATLVLVASGLAASYRRRRKRERGTLTSRCSTS